MDPYQQAIQRAMEAEEDMDLGHQDIDMALQEINLGPQGMISVQGAMQPQQAMRPAKQAMYPASVAMYPPQPATPPPPLQSHTPQCPLAPKKLSQPARPSRRKDCWWLLPIEPYDQEPYESRFRLFSRLPAELRIMIWECCLPTRVFEVNQPQWLKQKEKCEGIWTLRRRTLLPTVSQVCHEARQVAICAAISEEQIDLRRQTRGMWFQPKRDIVMMYRPDVPWTEDPLSMEEDMERLERHAFDTAIYSPMINPWGYQNSVLMVTAGMHHAPVTGWRDPLVIVDTIAIHAKEADVNTAGIFGKFRYESIQLVDPADTDMLERYRKLCMDRPRQTWSALRFFSNFTGGHKQVHLLRYHIMEWVNQGKCRELWRKWQAAKDARLAGIEYPAGI